jgi:hypothetical protein
MQRQAVPKPWQQTQKQRPPMQLHPLPPLQPRRLLRLYKLPK